jgi:heme-degrading monooxygenase HmoA
MYELYTFGRFEVPPENEDAFVAAWSEFAKWVSAQPGAYGFRLVRDTRNAGRFYSFGQWDDAEAVREWKSLPEFKEGLGRMVKLSSEFEPTELVVLKRAAAGNVETLSPPHVAPIHAPT